MKRLRAPFVLTFSTLSLAGCPDRSTKNPPPPTQRHTMNPPDLGSITPPTSASAPTTASTPTTASAATTSTAPDTTPRLLNGRDNASGKQIYRGEGARCFVYTDWKDNTPKPPGMMPPPRDVPCPPEMTKAPWDECRFGDIMTTAKAGDCVCNVPGNPPPPQKKLKCPSS